MEPNQQSGHHPLDVSLHAELVRIQSDFNRGQAEAASLQRILNSAVGENTRLRKQQRLGPRPGWLSNNIVLLGGYLEGKVPVQIAEYLPWTQDPPRAVRSLASMAAETLRRNLNGEEMEALQFLRENPHLRRHDPMLEFMEDIIKIERDFNNQDPARLTTQIRNEFLDKISYTISKHYTLWENSTITAECKARLLNLQTQVIEGSPHPHLNPPEQALHQLKRARFHSPVEGVAVGHRR
jgi:hypothetical protein